MNERKRDKRRKKKRLTHKSEKYTQNEGRNNRKRPDKDRKLQVQKTK